MKIADAHTPNPSIPAAVDPIVPNAAVVNTAMPIPPRPYTTRFCCGMCRAYRVSNCIPMIMPMPIRVFSTPNTADVECSTSRT